MKYIVMADGKELRWKQYMGIHKYQIRIDGESLLERTCRLVRENEPGAQLIITSHNSDICVDGAVRYEPKNNKLEVDRFTWELIEKDTVFLYGDCYYTEGSIKTIMSTETDGILFFGSYERIFAVKIIDSDKFKSCIEYVKQQFLQGKISECIGWQVYLASQGSNLEKKSISGDYVIITDGTRDFNKPADYREFQEKEGKSVNPPWDERPIGMFDSGIGGLSCVKAVNERLPCESICYYGDCLRAPYGTRSVEQIREFSAQIADFIYSMNVKAMIVACNTISSICLDDIRKCCPGIPVLGMLDMTGSYIQEKFCGARLGVIATPATISSGSYPRMLKKSSFAGEVFTLACPEFVEAVEAGIYSGPEAERLTENVLDEFIKRNKIQALVLGCTHFPFLQDTIHKLYPELNIIDPAKILAEGLKAMTERGALHPASGGERKERFFTSKLTTGFNNAVKEITKVYPKIEIKTF